MPKNPVEDYLAGCALTRSTGAATDETAYDSVLKALLDAAGHGLKPQGCLTTKSPWTASRPRCASASAWSASRPRRIVAASLRFGLRTTAHEGIGTPRRWDHVTVLPAPVSALLDVQFFKIPVIVLLLLLLVGHSLGDLSLHFLQGRFLEVELA